MTARLDQTARQVLELRPDPVPHYRVLREVLGRRPRRADLDGSRHVQALANAQQPDGGFGPLHRADASCTEGAVRRMNVLGLDRKHPLCRRTAAHLAGLLDGTLRSPDRAERNNRWPTGFELFAAATLTRLHPQHRATHAAKRKWRHIVARTFAAGGYDAAREIRVHRELTGASVANSYLCLDNKYSVQLLAHVPLEPTLRSAYFDWLWARPQLRYLLTAPAAPMSTLPARYRGAWLTTQVLLSAFPEWRVRFARHARDLWQQRDERGFWDLGPRRPGDLELPMSESWRPRNARTVDWTVRCLLLLKRAEQP